MSITVKEVGRSSQVGTSPTRERRYTILNAADVDAAEAALLSGTLVTKPSGFAGIPSTDNSLIFDSADLDMRDNSATTFDAVVNYRKIKAITPASTNDEEISFDISSQTVRVTQGKANVSKTAVSGTAPDFKGGIGYNGERFEGADIFAEQFSFTITKYKAAADVTNTYIQNLRNAAFHYNNATFRGQAAGECLFVGASGSKRNDDDYAIAHKFLVSKNLASIAVGDVTVAAKKGWEYLWALYESEEDATAKKLTPRPVAAYVEQVYDSIDLATTLGLTA